MWLFLLGCYVLDTVCAAIYIYIFFKNLIGTSSQICPQNQNIVGLSRKITFVWAKKKNSHLKRIEPLPSFTYFLKKPAGSSVHYWFVSGCLFHSIKLFSWLFLCVGPGLTVTAIFTLLRMVAHPCCSSEVRWTPPPLVSSALYTKPKQSHNDIEADLWISKDHLVLVLWDSK